MTDTNKGMAIQPLVCNTKVLLIRWCRLNGFVDEEGHPTNLPPEAVIAFHDELSALLQRTVELQQEQLVDWVNMHPLPGKMWKFCP